MSASYPARVERRQIESLCSHAIDDDESRAIETIVRLTLPPASVSRIVKLAEILHEAGLLSTQKCQAILKYAHRNSANSKLNQKSLQKDYPLSFAFIRLHGNTKGTAPDKVEAVRTLVDIAGKRPEEPDFSGEMFYKHVIGFRDVCEMYWACYGHTQIREPVARPDLRERLHLFIGSFKDPDSITETLRLKLQATKALIEKRLLLGSARSRLPYSRQQPFSIGKSISVSAALLDSLPETTYIQSAAVGDAYSEDEGTTALIELPDGSTEKDRQSVSRHVVSGFARTNVKTQADMSGCSLVTYRDFLAHAVNLAPDDFSLIWLSAFPGLDVHRPFQVQKNDVHEPQNDEILLTKCSRALLYNILRRRKKADPALYETCGLMALPVSRKVSDGVRKIVVDGSQSKAISDANNAARRFSKRHPGLTPTLTRLRASSRLHFTPRWLGELELSAIAGRVPPGLLAISAYYPHSARSIGHRFSDQYLLACKAWELPESFQRSLPIVSARRRDQVFRYPSPRLPVIREVFNSIQSAYLRACQAVQENLPFAAIEMYLNGLNAHELACYACQEIGIGLRPTGGVAQFSAASPFLGCMTADKGSRIFSERSFSPITDTHWKLLTVSRSNRAELAQLLRNAGLSLSFAEPQSSLACHFRLKDDGSGVSGDRITGAQFRRLSSELPGGYKKRDRQNWLRHFVAEHIGGKVPQWQADEFMAHRRIGREPLATWSTAGLAHFSSLRNLVEDLLSVLVPDGLLRPIPQACPRLPKRRGGMSRRVC